jgi:hypothetical protein
MVGTVTEPGLPTDRKPTHAELVEHVARLEGQLDRANRGRETWFKRCEEISENYIKERVEGLHLEPENVEWVVNDIGELGVKIGNQFFFLYKGRSLVYRTKEDIGEDGTDKDRILRWRPVYKREFGEVCHPPPKTEYSHDRGEMVDGEYSFGNEEDWQELPRGRQLP